MDFLPTPRASDAHVRGFSSKNCHEVWYRKTRMVWLCDGRKMLKTCLFVSTQYTNVSDGRTDRQTDKRYKW